MKSNLRKFVFGLFAVVLLAITAPALSQESDSAPPAEVSANGSGDAATTATDLGSLAETLGSITGIVALTMVLVEIIKRASAKVPFISDLPIWLIALFVGGSLAAAGSAAGYLQGNVVELIWQGAMSAATASGLYSWIASGTTSPAESALNRQG